MYEKSYPPMLGVGLRMISSSLRKSITAFAEISVSATDLIVAGYHDLYLSSQVPP